MKTFKKYFRSKFRDRTNEILVEIKDIMSEVSNKIDACSITDDNNGVEITAKPILPGDGAASTVGNVSTVYSGSSRPTANSNNIGGPIPVAATTTTTKPTSFN